MTQNKRYLGLLLPACLLTDTALANIDNLSNMSPEWIRTGNRNAATDAADAVVYNPAGIVELGDGFHVNIGNQSLFRKPSHRYDFGFGEEKHGQDGADWFLPNLYVTYNQGDWALFGGFYIPGGGAVVDYPNGSFTTDLIGVGMVMGGMFDGYTGESLKAQSAYNTFTFGGAYRFNEVVSAAFGLRYIAVQNNIKAGITGLTDIGGGNFVATPLSLDVDQNAQGVGYVAGLNIRLNPQLNLALQYQGKVGLDLKSDVQKDDLGLFTNGEKNARDLPGMLGLGLGYHISDALYTEINYSYWFQKQADWGKDANGNDISDMAGDAQSVGITASYRLSPTLLVSAGTTYTDFKWNDIDGYYEANVGSYEVLYSDNWHLGCGLAYTVADDVVLNLALARTVWDDVTLAHSSGVTINGENSTTIIAVGVDVGF